jgi:hypothetical protein
MSMAARLFVFVAFSVLTLVPNVLYAASLTFSPSTASKSVGEEFTVKVSVDPDGKSINAADGTITFDPAVLSVNSVSRDGSAFSLWTADPSYSNSAGTVTFSGGSPTALSSTGTLLTIKFKGKSAGTGVVSSSKASILAADGKGTNVFAKGSDATFTIAAGAPKPPPEPEPVAQPEPEPVSQGGGDSLVPAPDIQSSTHKKADQWYATTTAVLSWKVPPGMISVRTLISQDQKEKPKKVSTPAIDRQTVENLTEGVWYFSAQFKDDFEWGTIGVREVRIDITPPDEYDVAILDPGGDTPPKFVLGTTDALSGMNRYEIFIQGAIAATAKAADLVDNAFPIPPQVGGSQEVQIKAYDNAGNVREVKKQLDLPKVDAPKPKGAADDAPVQSGFRFEWVIIALFAFIVGGLVAWQVQMRKQAQRGQALLLQHVVDTRERNDKVFAALREEFEQLINDFDEKPQLTAAERNLLEKLKEALDISEEVVDTDIEDLKKLVKSQQ